MGSEDKFAVTLIDNDLPEGWALSRVSDFIELNYGKGLRESDRKVGSVPVYGSNGVVGKHNAALTKGPSIIIGRKGSVGAIQYSPNACWPIDTTYYIDNFSGLNPRFLIHALRSLDLANFDTSTAIPGLNRNDVYGQKIPLPPLHEQKRIVAKVEELLTRVNATKERLNKVSIILKRFRQAVLADACSGRLTADWREKNPDVEPAYELLMRIQKERGKQQCKKIDLDKINKNDLNALPKKWEYTALSNIAGIIMGQSPPGSAYNTEGRGMPLINGPVEFGDGPFGLTAKSKFTTKVTKVCKDGDLLICVRGSTTGRTNIAQIDSCIGRGVAAIRGELVEQWYLNYHIHSRYEEILSSGTGSTFPNISSGYLERLIVPLPPLLEQKEIVRRVEGMFKLADAMEKRVSAATARAEKLTQAILAKAFRGELVPTEAELARREGRSYESASELLFHIKSEHELKEVKKRSYRRPKSGRGS